MNIFSHNVNPVHYLFQREKFASEPAFLAVLLRLMTTLLPWLSYLTTLDRWIASRFSCIASVILEWSSCHPVVQFEGTVFFERLSAHGNLVGTSSCCVVMTDNIAATAMPFLLSVLQPPYSKVLAEGEQDFSSCHGPLDVQRSAVICLREIFSCSKSSNDSCSFTVGKALFSFLHDRCGRRHFRHFSTYRSLALSRAVINYFEDCQLLEADTIELIQAILKVQMSDRKPQEQSFIGLQWLLYSRCLMSGDVIKASQSSDDAETNFSMSTLAERARIIARFNATNVLKYSNPPRWQLKCIAANIASVIINMLSCLREENIQGSYLFNYKAAHARCLDIFRNEDKVYGLKLHSYPIFHLEDLVTTACSVSTATSNHSELPSGME